jgi:hypothetical protein
MKFFNFLSQYNELDLENNLYNYNQDYEFQSYSEGILIQKYSNESQIILPYKSLIKYYDRLFPRKSFDTFLIECGKYDILNNYSNEQLIEIVSNIPTDFDIDVELYSDEKYSSINYFIIHIYSFDLITEGMNKCEKLSWDEKYRYNIFNFEDLPNKYSQNRMIEQVQLMRYKWIKFKLEELKVASIQTINYLKLIIPTMEKKIIDKKIHKPEYKLMSFI